MNALEIEVLHKWVETGETPTAHVTVGKLNLAEVKRCVRDAPDAVLRQPGPRSEYVDLACRIELARRGPPSGWRYPVVGWICYDAKEGWRPLLRGQEGKTEVY